MSINVNLGGDRIGSGNKMNVHLKGFERSTFDLSKIIRTTAAPGVLYPVYQNYALNGDSWEIKLNSLVRTLPTTAPVFGSFKMQIDFFKVPIRLYVASLKNNKLDVGMNMSNINLPKIRLRASKLNLDSNVNIEEQQFSQSSLNAYLGIRGIGMNIIGQNYAQDWYNAIGHLAYYDIFKNYYANKQEEKAYVIMNEGVKKVVSEATGDVRDVKYWNQSEWLNYGMGQQTGFVNEKGNKLYFRIKAKNITEVEKLVPYLRCKDMEDSTEAIKDIFPIWNIEKIEGTKYYSLIFEATSVDEESYNYIYLGSVTEFSSEIKLDKFDLTNIDEIIEYASRNDNVTINDVNKSPLNVVDREAIPNSLSALGEYQSMSRYPMNGLLVKTYQSDIFNNWVSTEWIDGSNGINSITSVSTDGDEFTIDSLILASRIHKMLLRIAVSGGSYQDWQEAVWGEKVYGQYQTPIYIGGMSTTIQFDEVISTAETEDGELGGLAGRGTQSGNIKGGYIKEKIDEPSIIMGIMSITPYIDYSQGNKWFVHLKNMDNFHKPNLDGIGFQELITEQMAFWDNRREGNLEGHTNIKYSAGKQPAWINYQTDYNELFGEFAEQDKAMYMTLARRYESKTVNGYTRLADITTYIDPMKFNYIFNYKSLDAQNFWVQVAMDITARRKMSSKVIPNL